MALYNENGDMQEREYTLYELNEQVDALMEAGLIQTITAKARQMLKNGQAIFKRKFKKIVDKKTGEEIEDTSKTKDKETDNTANKRP